MSSYSEGNFANIFLNAFLSKSFFTWEDICHISESQAGSMNAKNCGFYSYHTKHSSQQVRGELKLLLKKILNTAWNIKLKTKKYSLWLLVCNWRSPRYTIRPNLSVKQVGISEARHIVYKVLCSFYVSNPLCNLVFSCWFLLTLYARFSIRI